MRRQGRYLFVVVVVVVVVVGVVVVVFFAGVTVFAAAGFGFTAVAGADDLSEALLTTALAGFAEAAFALGAGGVLTRRPFTIRCCGGAATPPCTAAALALVAAGVPTSLPFTQPQNGDMAIPVR
jgi:hypothetical protein